MTEGESLSPGEKSLRRDFAAGRFLSGQAARRWQLLSINWPYAIIEVFAADGQAFGFRFECTGYPYAAVTAQPWEVVSNGPLAPGRWPKGSSRIPLAFNPGWKGGACLYLPCDRQSIEGHDNWRHQYPSLLWDPAKGICKYLGIIHELLNSSEYAGRHAA